MLESICYKRSTQEEAIAMDYSNHITNHEKDKHLTYEDYAVIELRLEPQCHRQEGIELFGE